MQSWIALLPDRPARPAPPRLRLIGRLPAQAYLAILQFLPVPDIAVVARCSRQLAALTRDDRVWLRKLRWLDYRGPGAVPLPALDLESDLPHAAEALDRKPTGIHLKGTVLPTPQRVVIPPAPPAATTLFSASGDDDFGDFFDGDAEGDVSTVHDDGFGDFQDFGRSRDLESDFSEIRLNGTGKPRPAETGQDLLMMWDDGEPDPPKRTPPPPSVPIVRPPSPVPRASLDRPTYRDIFITHHKLLLPYYISLTTHTTSSLVFTSPTLNPSSRSQLLSSLVRFCSPLLAPTRSLPQRQTVLRNVQSAMDFFESAMLAEFERADSRRDEASMREKAAVLWALNGASSVIQVFVQKREIFYDQSHNALKNLVKIETPSGAMADGIDFSAMDTYMKHVLHVVNREGSLIARVFPSQADALIYFTERIANDVVSDYITSLLSAAQPLQPPLFLLATAATFGQVYRLVDTVLAIEPKSELVTKERAEDVIFRMFEPLMDDYLAEEADWIRSVLEEVCAEWDAKTASELAISDPNFLASQNPAQVKRNVLAGFTKVLLLPVTIIPKTAAFGFNVISIGATGAFNTVASLGAGFGAGFGSSGSATPKQIKIEAKVEPPVVEAAWSIDSATVDPSPSLTHSRTPSTASVMTTPKRDRFAQMQLLLSLDTALQLIQANRDCLKRVQTFVRYPGIYGGKVRDAIEEVFIILLQTMGEKHVCVAFGKATTQMANYKPEEHVEGTSVAPLVQFFELVHIGDTIQQMVEVYFDKEMAAYIDKKDFLNAVVREKKRFEAALDDSVAQGLNAGVNILMNQVEHILLTRQESEDFCPPVGAELDLQPSTACREVLECLATHCGMLRGSTDKQILEVFHQEVGIRLHGLLLKHIKRIVVSVDGGFGLIADLNAYHNFVATLRQPQITAYFVHLKLVGELFVIDSPKDLGQLVRDVARYEGTLSADDLYEIIKRREDWREIESQVERELFGLRREDCCVS